MPRFNWTVCIFQYFLFCKEHINYENTGFKHSHDYFGSSRFVFAWNWPEIEPDSMAWLCGMQIRLFNLWKCESSPHCLMLLDNNTCTPKMIVGKILFCFVRYKNTFSLTWSESIETAVWVSCDCLTIGVWSVSIIGFPVDWDNFKIKNLPVSYVTMSHVVGLESERLIDG